MATAVKMDAETKSKLETLQAEIKLRTGRKVTQQALLSRLIESAYESRGDLIESYREGSEALSDDAVERFFSVTFESGAETTADDIDDILYG